MNMNSVAQQRANERTNEWMNVWTTEWTSHQLMMKRNDVGCDDISGTADADAVASC